MVMKTDFEAKLPLAPLKKLCNKILRTKMSQQSDFQQRVINRYKLLRHELRVNNALKILASFLLIAGIISGAYLVERGYRYFTGAAVFPISVYFSPSMQSLPPDSRMSVMVDTGQNAAVDFARVEFRFDNTKVNLASEISTATELGTVIQKTSMGQANSTGEVVIVLGRSPGSPTVDGIIEFASFDVRAVGSAAETTQMEFEVEGMQFVNSSSEAITDISAGNATLELNQVSSSGARLYFSNPRPANPQKVGSQFAIDVMLDTGGQDVDGVDARIHFDKTILSGVTVQTSGGVFSSFPANNVDNTNGLVVLSANVGSSTSTSPVNGSDLVVGTILYNPTSASSGTNLTYDFSPGSRNDSNVVLSGTTTDPVDILESVSNASIVVTATSTATPAPTVVGTTPTPVPGTTATPTPIVTATPIGGVSVNLQLGFQGVTRSGANRSRGVTINGRTSSGTDEFSLNTSTNTNGVALVSLNAGNYRLRIDSPGYLARVFGTTSSPIVIGSSTTLVNLSSTPLLGGDFNNDGVVNDIDYTLHFLTSYGKSSDLVDLDRSGQVNNLDYGVMRTNFNLVDDSF